MKKNALMFVINEKYVFALGTLLYNLKAFDSSFYQDILVVHSGISEKDKENLLKINSNIIFHLYTYEDFINDHNLSINEDEGNGLTSNFLERYSYLAYIKYKIFEFLTDYAKIMFLDVDILILNNFGKIFELEGVAWRNGETLEQKIKKGFDGVLPEDKYLANIVETTTSPNGGLFYVTDQMPYLEMANIAKEFLIKYISKYQISIDEVLMALPVNYYDIQTTSLDPKVYNTVPKNVIYKTAIVHFAGDKVWDKKYLANAFPEWWTYYKFWVKETDHEHNLPLNLNRNDLVKDFKLLTSWPKIIVGLDVPKTLKLSSDFQRRWLHIAIHNVDKNIYYELIMSHQFDRVKCGLWFKSISFTKDEYFINRLERLKEKGFIANYESSDKGIYISSIECKFQSINEIFLEFYRRTFPLVEEFA